MEVFFQMPSCRSIYFFTYLSMFHTSPAKFLICHNLNQIHKPGTRVLFFLLRLIIDPAAHQTKLQAVRIFIIHHASVIFHSVTFLFHIRKYSLRRIRVYAFHIVIVSSRIPVIIIQQRNRIGHIER